MIYLYWVFALIHIQNIILSYSIVNTCVRNTSHNIIGSWITLNIQDTTEEGKRNKINLNKWYVYEISTVYTMYFWFDWFIYIHLLLAQIDIVLVEVVSDVSTNIFITWWYLKQVSEPDKVINTTENPIYEIL